MLRRRLWHRDHDDSGTEAKDLRGFIHSQFGLFDTKKADGFGDCFRAAVSDKFVGFCFCVI
jgi:hypothetical protein